MNGATKHDRIDAAIAELQTVRAARNDERLRIAALEQERRALEDNLSVMERSAGRRLFLRGRAALTRAISVVTHPIWTAGTASRAIAAGTPLPSARAAYRHLRWRTLPLRLSTPVARQTSQPAAVEAIRWIGPITIRHTTHEALLCHLTGCVDFSVQVRGEAEFVTACAISPNAWAHEPSAAEFQVSLRIPAIGWNTARTLRIDVTTRYTDRRWHELRIRLPRSADAVQVEVRLETRVAHGGDDRYGWTVFGEPRFEWRRPAPEVRQSLNAFLARLKSGGLREAFAAARRAPSAEEAAMLYSRFVEADAPAPEQLAELGAEIAALPQQPLISVLTPVYNTPAQWLRACIESVRRQAYPNWEHCLCDDGSTSPETAAVLREFASDPRIRIVRLERNAGISAATNAALDLARGDYIALLDHDDELTPDALARVVQWINANPWVEVLYSDEDKLETDGVRCDPFFKPGWSPEHFLHCMYTCHVLVARRALVQDAGGFRAGYEGAQDYDLMLRLIERTHAVGHIPRVLYHWRKIPGSTAAAQAAKPWAEDAGKRALEDYVRRRGIDAEVRPGAAPGLFRIQRRIIGTPLVSIVVPTRGQVTDRDGTPLDLLASSIESIGRRTSWKHYEFIIVGDASPLQPSTVRALSGTQHRILHHQPAGRFNFSCKINEGVAAASGEHVLLLNDDVEALDADWLSAMLEYSQDPEIGAVGAQLLYPDGRLQHVGMVLGVNGIAAHAFHQHPGTSAGYFGSVIGPRNYSAVTAACLMSRRAVFLQVSGFDETFPIDFNDVDYCLRVRRAGYRIVYTPYARLLHHESASFGPRQQDTEGIAEMQRRWGSEIQKDPYYNPNLTREYPDYRIQLPHHR